jgi:TonB family protein
MTLRNTLACALVFAALAAAGSLARAAEGESAPVPVAALPSFLTDEDYPDEAIRNGEQGEVEFRLDIGVDGRVSGCSVVRSSGSAILDAATCRIMSERATFRAATDDSGRLVPGSVVSRISWRLPEGANETIQLPARAGEAINLWSNCAFGEAAKLTLTSLSPEAVAKQALSRSELVQSGRVELQTGNAMAAFRGYHNERIIRSVTKTRATLQPQKVE